MRASHAKVRPTFREWICLPEAAAPKMVMTSIRVRMPRMPDRPCKPAGEKVPALRARKITHFPVN
jgi:hypothetical protein